MKIGVLLIILMLGLVHAAGEISVNLSLVEGENITASVVYHAEKTPVIIPPTYAVSDTIRRLATFKDGVYIIDFFSSGLKRSAIAIKFKEEAVEEAAAQRIEIKEYADLGDIVPVGSGGLELLENEITLGTFVHIEGSLKDVDWVILKIKYTDEELKNKGVREDSLNILWHDNKKWVKLLKGSPEWVDSVGIDTVKNYVWVNMSSPHLSVYGLSGAPTANREIVEVKTLPPTPAVRWKSGGYTVAFLLLLLFFIKVLRK